MAPGTPIDWQDSPSTATPVNAANLKHHDAWMVEQVEAAQGSANAAAASAVEAAAPGDDQVAAFVADATPSATRAQVDAVVAGGVATAEAYTAAQVAALQAQSASIEDLFVSVTIQTGLTTTWPNAGNASLPLFSAPFPLAITSVVMLMWASAGNAPLSETVYWLVELRKTDATWTTTTVLAQKSTKTTALASPGGPASNGVPAGTAITSRIPWAFGAGILAGATLDAGDSLSWNTLPVSTPVGMYGMVTVTIGYRPL